MLLYKFRMKILSACYAGRTMSQSQQGSWGKMGDPFTETSIFDFI